ncbi:MAG: hypothetical protein GXP56_02935 [Deltaproteobacteria bacterium]|nr:hypothetical protein [Deltaproteobacteria bacterium]
MKHLLFIIIPFAWFTILTCGDKGLSSSNAGQRHDGAYKLNTGLSGSLQNPAFSPDGKSVVFTRFHDGYNKGSSDLYVYHLKTKKLKPLVSDGSSNVNLPGSAWNDKINAVVFSSDREPHDEIFLISDTGGTTGDEIQLTNRQDKQSYEPAFSPAGQWIVFESHNIDAKNNGVITKYKIDGSSGYIDLTASGENAGQPDWSPAGDKILYQKENNGKWAIWTMDIFGRNKTMITSLNESNTDAVFSQDGQWIIYSSENDNVKSANIYKIPSNGGVPTRITRSEAYDGAPSISPDGTKIAFESIYGNPEESNGTAIWILNIPGT